MPLVPKVRRAKRSSSSAAPAAGWGAYVRASLQVQSAEFFAKSTLHGVKYVAGDHGHPGLTSTPKRPACERLLWFACVSVGCIAAVVIIFNLWEKFQVNPTITGLDTDFHNWDVPFPAVYLCPAEAANRTRLLERLEAAAAAHPSLAARHADLLADLLDLDLDRLPRFLAAHSPDALADFPPDLDIRDTVYEMADKCEHVFDRCTFKSQPFDCCNEFTPILTENGLCYAFNARHARERAATTTGTNKVWEEKYIKETDMKWSLNLSVRYTEGESGPAKVFIVDAEEVPGAESRPQHVWHHRVWKVLFSVKHTYTTDNTRQLSVRQRHCLFPDEARQDAGAGAGAGGGGDASYTALSCARRCRARQLLSGCGCVPHFMPMQPAGAPRCSLAQLACAARLRAASRSPVLGCGCYLGCSYTAYEVEKLELSHEREEADGASGGSDGTDPSVASLEAEFVSWPMVRYKREVLFGWVDLLVSFGGIAGLFLGLSLLSGVEVFYYFVMRSACMVVRERDRLDAHRRLQSDLRPPDYDLNLVPYFVADPLPGRGIHQIIAGTGFTNHHRKVDSEKSFGVWKSNKNKYGMLPPFGIDFMN